MIDKYEHSKFLISRFDHYYDTINSKGSFYIGLNTFILGGLCAGTLSIENKVSRDFWFWIQLVFGFGLCIISIIYTIKAIAPFVKDNESNDDDPSIDFFWWHSPGIL